MDNTIIPYGEASDISSEDLDDSSDDDLHSHLLSNNIGVHYNNFNTQHDFMNMENAKEYESIRNKYFTPEILKTRLLIETNNIKHTKIYLNPVDSFNLRHSLFSLIHTDYKIEQNNRLELVIYYENLNSKIEILEQEMKGGGTRT